MILYVTELERWLSGESCRDDIIIQTHCSAGAAKQNIEEIRLIFSSKVGRIKLSITVDVFKL